MLLSFTSIDKQGNFRECAWWLTTLEAAFDALSTVSAKGNQIISAELTDNGQRTILSVDAFDGELFSDSIKVLESEWQQILQSPVIYPSINRNSLSKSEKK